MFEIPPQLGRNKVISLPNNNSTGKLLFTGSNNYIEFGANVTLLDVVIKFTGSNGKIFIGDNTVLRGAIRCNGAAEIIIGNGTKMNAACRLHASKDCFIKVGSNCLFSDVRFRTSDAHYIYDENDVCINPSKSIEIGNNVWIAEHVHVYKGVSIGNGAVVGACSVVTRNIPDAALAVGVPAKVVKTGIKWKE